MSYHQYDDFGFDYNEFVPPDHHNRPSIKLRIFGIVLCVCAFCATVFNSKEEGDSKTQEQVSAPVQQPPKQPLTPPMISVIPDPDATQVRLNEPPPEKNPYNPKGEPLN